jgi:hypothetical protein
MTYSVTEVTESMTEPVSLVTDSVAEVTESMTVAVTVRRPSVGAAGARDGLRDGVSEERVRRRRDA